MANIAENRWRGRPYLSAGLRAFVFAAPIVVAAFASAVTAGAVNDSVRSLPLRWAIVIAGSLLVLLVADRLARRLLPLAVLLRMDLAFPGKTPSRLGVGLDAANLRELEERVRIARTMGFGDDPDTAAEMTLSLVAAAEAHDRATRGHAERVRAYADLLAEDMNVHPSERDKLRWAALLHDVGKLEVPISVLNKPGPLDARELEVVRRHPEEGARLTRPLHAWLGEWADAITQHHERWDGRGYPNGLEGSDLSLAARIIAVADVYETMTAARPYHRPKTQSEARRELIRCAGAQFDPQVVNAFLELPIRRLRAVSGPATWIANMPVLRGVERVNAFVGRVASAAAVAGGALAVSIAQATLHR
jgi:putative nucleotidyltransferase with HDIG domain